MGKRYTQLRLEYRVRLIDIGIPTGDKKDTGCFFSSFCNRYPHLY